MAVPTQHPDEHRPQHPILLAVDQELGEAAPLGDYPASERIGMAIGLK